MFKNISKKRIPFVILFASVSLLTILSFVFLFLASLDKGGANFVKINSYIGYIFQTIGKNAGVFVILIIAGLIMIAAGVLFLLLNLKRERKLLCLQGLFGLVGAYEIVVWLAYFFCHMFGMNIGQIPCSYIGFVITVVNSLAIVALLVVDYLTGSRKIAYVIQEPTEEERL